jgi:hypothetical protein
MIFPSLPAPLFWVAKEMDTHAPNELGNRSKKIQLCRTCADLLWSLFRRSSGETGFDSRSWIWPFRLEAYIFQRCKTRNNSSTQRGRGWRQEAPVVCAPVNRSCRGQPWRSVRWVDFLLVLHVYISARWGYCFHKYETDSTNISRTGVEFPKWEVDCNIGRIQKIWVNLILIQLNRSNVRGTAPARQLGSTEKSDTSSPSVYE